MHKENQFKLIKLKFIWQRKDSWKGVESWNVVMNTENQLTMIALLLSDKELLKGGQYIIIKVWIVDFTYVVMLVNVHCDVLTYVECMMIVMIEFQF